MNIRKATTSDVKTLQNLNDELFQDNSKYDPDINIDWAQSEAGHKYFSKAVNDKNTICLIVEDNGKPIGYIAASPIEIDYRLSRYIEINNMGVSPAFRSKGIGSELIEECMRIAKQRGFDRIYVNAYSDNIKAIKFYERNGFGKIDVSLEKDL